MEKSQNNEESEKIVKPKRAYERKQKSLAWDYFEKLSSTRVRCRLCALEQSYQGNTWNILRHLKSIHKIDATKRGQTQTANADQTLIVKNTKRQNSEEDDQGMRSISSSDEYKPYTLQDNEPLVEFPTENILYSDAVDSLTRKRCSPKRKNSLEDDRIIAETEYFREKAAFFRIQKHLAALQAKKIKFELDQLYLMHNRNAQ